VNAPMRPEHMINRAIARAGGYVVYKTNLRAIGINNCTRFRFARKDAPKLQPDWPGGYRRVYEAWAAAADVVIAKAAANSEQRNSLASQARALFGSAP